MKEEAKKLALRNGAAAVGVSSTDRLAGGPAGNDARYVLPSAKSILSIMLPFDGDIIRRYLGKEDHAGFQKHETDVYRRLYEVAKSIEIFLVSEGFEAVACEPNLDYRYKDSAAYRRTPYKVRQGYVDWVRSKSGAIGTALRRASVGFTYDREAGVIDWDLTPAFSHRAGAVAAGLAAYGWSGNVLSPEYGARVLFNTVVTSAELESDPVLTESPCDRCKYCARVCQVGMIDLKEKDPVVVNGVTFDRGKRGHNLRCIFGCGGMTGQGKYKGWSTWSPGRVDLPEADDGMVAFWDRFSKQNLWQHNYYSKVLADLVYHSEYGFVRKPGERFMTTCANCQIVCWQSRQERKENYEILTNGGEVVEGPGFSFQLSDRN